jgi:hypothetical protein
VRENAKYFAFDDDDAAVAAAAVAAVAAAAVTAAAVVVFVGDVFVTNDVFVTANDGDARIGGDVAVADV